MNFRIASGETREDKSFEIRSLWLAAWAGRDTAALERHIAELQQQGVARPANTPEFYRVEVDRLTMDDRIEVSSTSATGEVEAVILKAAGHLWAGLGSDHTDRKLEAIDVQRSKQACSKPIANRLWRFEEIESHWDEIIIRSYRREEGAAMLYQNGTLGENLHPRALIDLFEERSNEFSDGTMLFCGTIPTREKIKFARRFEMELHDPILDRRIRHAYDIVERPSSQVEARL